MNYRWIGVILLLCCTQEALSEQVDFAGMLTSFGHGRLPQSSSFELPAPYTGSFFWDKSARQAYFTIEVPTLRLELLGESPGPPDSYFKFQSPNLYSAIAPDPATIAPSRSEVIDAVGLLQAMFVEPEGLFIHAFEIDIDLREGEGNWKISKSCPACFYVGFSSASGTIDSVTRFVPEPTCMALLVTGLLLVANRRSRCLRNR